MYINKVMIYGNLTRDPEVRATVSGTAVCNLSVATNRSFKDKEGNKKEEVEFHSVVVFGKQADSIGMFLKKGSGVFVEGHLQTRSWEKDSVKHYKTEVVADHVTFGPKKSGEGEAASEELSDAIPF